MYDRVAVLQLAALRKRVEELEAEIKAVRNAPN
jgi:uncharacterized protein (UPF0335 family)